jgi:drug/metabolite transporter (DMT)-like permease
MFRLPPFDVPSPTTLRRPLADVGALAASVAGMALAAPLINDTAGVGPLAIALWRNLFSVLAVVPVLLWQHRSRPPHLSWRDLVATVGAGLLFAVYLGLWIPSLRLTGVASSTGLSFAVAPIWVLVIRRLRGDPLSRHAWAGTLLAVGGVLALTGIDLSRSADHLIGDLLALASGIAIAGYLVIGAQTRRRVDTTTYTTVCYGTSAVVLAFACVISATPTSGYSVSSWIKIALLTLSVQLIGHSLNTRAVKTLGIGITSTAILLETPGATLIEGCWHHAWPTPTAQAAIVLVLTGLVIVVRATPRPTLPPPPSRWAAVLQLSRRRNGTTGRSPGHGRQLPLPRPPSEPRDGRRSHRRAVLTVTLMTVTALTALHRRRRTATDQPVRTDTRRATFPAPRR